MSQVTSVAANVASLTSRSPIISIAQIAPQLMPVTPKIAPVRTYVTPIRAAINSVVSQIAPNIPTVGAQRKRRSQNSKAQQTDNSSSHIASLVFPRLYGLVYGANP